MNKHDENPINLIAHLDELKKNKSKIDIDVYLGKEERIRVRLIGLKVPQNIVDARRDQYIQAHGRKKTPSEDLLAWYKYTLMVTNITRETLSLKSILKLYRIRWQIELFFKNMKSQLKVDNINGENKYRILCLLYSKLTLTWIIALLFALAQNMSGNLIISFVKFTKWLRDVGDWQKVLAERKFTELIEAYKRDMDLLKKSVKRKT